MNASAGAGGRDPSPPAPEGGRPGPARFGLVWVLPTVTLLALFCLPLIAGERTLFLRDVFGTHLEMKWFQAEAMAEGRLPLIDPYRAGGQAHLGNPNTVALYPTNLLFAVADFFWAFNAHFWIHLLLAPLSFYWLGRAWRLPRDAAWVGGVAFAASGYYLSNLNLYNLVAPVTLAPALIAACLTAAGSRSPLRAAAVAVLWALVLVGGDPMTAAAALALALSALLVRVGRRWREGSQALMGLGIGTLLAAPQLIEFLRILPHSFRGLWGFSVDTATVASFDPRAAAEWLLPLFFGWPNLGFWGREFSAGDMPLLFSLAPGVVVLALVLASGRPFRHVSWWAWGSVAAGLFLALGGHNPLFRLLLHLPGLGAIRLPIKFWLLVAIGGGLLAALGYERLSTERGRSARRALAALSAVYALVWLFLALGGDAAGGWARSWVPPALSDGYVEQERLRWAGVAFVSLLVALGSLGIVVLGGRRRALLALLPVLHVASQMFFLKPLLPTDEIAPHLEPPPLLAAVPEDVTVVHGDQGGLFGSTAVALDRYPDLSLVWFQRQVHDELHPRVGQRFGRRYELDVSAEGLDAFLTRATAQAVALLPDPAKIQLLAASGVGRLVVSRRLEVLEAAGHVALVEIGRSAAGEVYVYAIPQRVERARVVSDVLRSPHLNGTLETLTAPGFDARGATVVPGADDTRPSPGNPLGIRKVPDGASAPKPPPPAAGRVTWVEDTAESMVLDVSAPDGGVLVVQRTPLAILSAWLDGEEVAILPADLHRIGVELPPGDHRVEIRAERTWLRVGFGLSGLASLTLLALAWRARSIRA